MHKYHGAAMYLLMVHGVFTPQARDLFSAGSVAMRKSGMRGGNYILRALEDIQDEMREASEHLDDELFEEYWGFVPPASERLMEWLRLADSYARDWKPSDHLFLSEQRRG